MKSKYNFIWAFIIYSCCLFPAWIDPFKDHVEEGNRAYGEGKYDEALGSYKKSGSYLPNKNSKYGLAFNRGDALYKKGQYEDALDDFKYSLGSSDSELQKRALFNMGNSNLKLGRYKEAMDSYRNALKIDPDFVKAKQNIEYMLKEQKKDKKNNKSEQNKNNQKGNEKNQNQGENRDKNSRKDEKNNPGNKSMNRKKMDRQQVENILKSMKNKPVRRQKGRGDGRRSLEKYW